MAHVEPPDQESHKHERRISTAMATIIGAFIGAVITALPAGVNAWIDLQKYNDEVALRRQAEVDRDSAQRAAKGYQQAYDVAAERFTNTLGGLIEQASVEANRREGPSQLIPAAKALVSTRDGYRSDLENIGSRLDSDIDALGQELAKTSPDQRHVAILVETLRRKWPGKKDEIDLAVRKLLTELGLVTLGKGMAAPDFQETGTHSQ
jgi:hypothetical protein